MPFNLVPSPKSILGLAMAIKSLLLQYVVGHRMEKTATQLNQVQHGEIHTECTFPQLEQ